MGWKCNNYYFCHLTEFISADTFRNRCPTPPSTPPACLRASNPRDQDPPDATCATRDGEASDYSCTWTTSYFCRQKKRNPTAPRPRYLPTRPPRARRNPKKGHCEPAQIYEHLGLHIYNITSTLRAPTWKLHAIATLSRTLLQRSTRDFRWLPAGQLAALARKA
jgi:hypothetical protein